MVSQEVILIERFSSSVYQWHKVVTYPLQIVICSSGPEDWSFWKQLEKKRLQVPIEVTMFLPRLRSITSIYVTIFILNYQNSWSFIISEDQSNNQPLQSYSGNSGSNLYTKLESEKVLSFLWYLRRSFLTNNCYKFLISQGNYLVCKELKRCLKHPYFFFLRPHP